MEVNQLYIILLRSVTIDAMESDQSNIHLEIDQQNKIFRMSTPVFSGSSEFPKSVAKFFTCLPQGSAYLSLKNEDGILFQEEFPFSGGSMRQEFYQFLQKARQCRHLLDCVEQLERLRDANSLLES